MAYQALTETPLINYIKSSSALERIFLKDALLTAKEVGDGNLNRVYTIQTADGLQSSTIVKQAFSCLYILDES